VKFKGKWKWKGKGKEKSILASNATQEDQTGEHHFS